MGLIAGRGACPLAFGDNDERRCAWCGDPIGARRRRWCSDECGRAFSDNHAWTSAREAARERDGFRCQHETGYGSICGAAYPLEVHHVEPVGVRGYSNGCQHHVDGLVTLCRAHHLAADRELRVERAVAWAEDRVRRPRLEQLRLAFAA